MVSKKRSYASQIKNRKTNKTAINSEIKNKEFSRFNESDKSKETYNNLIELATKIETSYLGDKEENCDGNFII